MARAILRDPALLAAAAQAPELAADLRGWVIKRAAAGGA